MKLVSADSACMRGWWI